MTTKTYEQKTWSLADLYPDFDTPELKSAIEEIEKKASEFEALRSQLSEDMSETAFMKILDSYEKLARLNRRVGYYAGLRFNEDTQNQKAQNFQAQTQQLLAQAENTTMFFKLWWKGLDDKPAERLMAAADGYRYWLEVLRLQKPYTLSEPEERVVNLKDVNGPNALVTLYTAITNRYVFRLTVDGEEKELTRGELSVHVQQQDADLRAAAYKELYRVYEHDANILGQIYQYLLRDWSSENIDLRGMASPIAARNLANNVPDDVVDTLLDVCRDNAGIFQRYFQFKAKKMGVKRLRRYDIYAPVSQYEKKIPYAEGVEATLESFREFDPGIADLAAQVFDEDHIDSEVRKGKNSGAFCATAGPDLTPWVLMSYQGLPNDAATLAHELGHAVHSLLARKHNVLSQSPSLPMAETASTFAEMLLIDHLLAKDPDPELKQLLLFRQMDDAYATIMRQAFFAMFEREAHARVQEGATVDDLSDLYLENLKDQFGESLDLSDDFRFEWLAIPHFYHTPFYVYAYAFGQLLVLSLYQQYLNEGKSFIPRYIEILAAGGSDSPARVLERAGIDFKARAFWQGGFDVLASSLKDLEAIKID
jgi:oligoendopeptidase F